MVSTKLWAGLGNQLFMIANAIGYAKTWGQQYWFPKQTINPHVWKTYFNHLPGEPEQFFKYTIYKEPSHAYHEIPYFANVMFEGFFQSSKYFDHARGEVLKAFAIPWSPLKGHVSIHVRRGDYLLYPDKHPVVTVEYLRDAIMLMVENGYRNFVVTSDDISWCRKNIDYLRVHNIEFSYSAKHTEMEDLALQSCCEHQIISNSSFSWWGHWLNQNPDKICIAPSTWFGPANAHLSTQSIYPENAIIL